VKKIFISKKKYELVNNFTFLLFIITIFLGFFQNSWVIIGTGVVLYLSNIFLTVFFTYSGFKKNKSRSFSIFDYLTMLLLFHTFYLIILKFNHNVLNIYGFQIKTPFIMLSFFMSVLVYKLNRFIEKKPK